MKKILILGTCLLAVLSCEKKGTTPEPTPEKTTVYPVRFSPVMTKVTDTKFEKGDAIGVTMVRSEGVTYADNLKMVYDGSVFSGSLMWYPEGTDGAAVTAYHPYNEAGPASFSVQADQSEGTSASDFVAAVKTGVLPSAHAVTLPFKHKLTRIILNVTNKAEGEPTAIILKGAKLAAKIATDDFTAVADDEAAAGSITAHKMSATQYELILPPQEVALIATVITAAGNELSQALQSATLKAGTQYSISMIVNPADLKVAFGDEISAWEDGGELGSDNTLIEKLSQGYIIYHEDVYTVAKMQDGKWWMTQNLRYVPEGITVSDQLSVVDAGVYYPIAVNPTTQKGEFTRDITVIQANGYLYQVEVALGKSVGFVKTQADAESLNGAQGLCPKGWHVPTSTDILNLVGKAVAPFTNNTSAPYYSAAAGNCVLSDLNADDFNMSAYGAVNITTLTATSATLMAALNTAKTAINTGFIMGSTYASSTSTNFQFLGLMPFISNNTCNGSKINVRSAYPVRCVRND